MKKRRERPYGFWNWGTGIAIAIGCCVLAMLFLVYKTTTVNFDMVEKDYYEAEMHFDQKKAALANTLALSRPIQIEQQNDFLIIQFPEECIRQEIEGDLVIYRPSNGKLDVELPFILDERGMIMIEDKRLRNGKYILKGDWLMNGEEYSVEQTFFVQK